MIKRDIVIVGAGPAGLAAAVAAYDAGVTDILMIEREGKTGGILKQCIHPGFGLHRFGCELTGPEYAQRYIDEAEKRNIETLTGTFVIDVTEDRVVTYQNGNGIFSVQAGAVILAMGCRERPRGALNIPGTRPSGIFSAGTAQKLINIEGYLPGKSVVILGSGDIGLIMARRLTLEGAKVHAVCEIMPYSGGLTRNIEQCLNDFNIPLLLSHTVTQIHGDKRLTGVTVSKVDENRVPIKGTEIYFDCDTLLLSVGLIPENELTEKAGIKMDRVTGGASVDANRQSSVEGIFACGNVLHVHDLVDFVSAEAELAGRSAAEYVKNGSKTKAAPISVQAGDGIRYTVPQTVYPGDDAEIYFRFSDVSRNVTVTAYTDGDIASKKKVIRAAPGEMQKIRVKVPDNCASVRIGMSK